MATSKDFDIMRKAWAARIHAYCVKRLGTCLETTDGRLFHGFNGPALNVDDCNEKHAMCPREEYSSGQGLHKCQAVHAEMRGILYCAKFGIRVEGATLYCSFGIPCKDCMKEIIAVGISRLVVTRMTFYDELSKELLEDFKNIGGIVEVLRVVQCPSCYSLNANKDGLAVYDKDILYRCSDCKIKFADNKEIYVGD